MATRMMAWDNAGHVREFRGKHELLEFLGSGYTQLFHAVETGTPIKGWFVDEALTDEQGNPLKAALMDAGEQARKAFQRRLEEKEARQNGRRS